MKDYNILIIDDESAQRDVLSGYLKKKGYKICALELTDKSIPHYSLNKSDLPMCLLIGNEITGVSQDLIDLCDVSIEIPQFGIKQSLNVAVAYGIAIFELRKVFDME